MNSKSILVLCTALLAACSSNSSGSATGGSSGSSGSGTAGSAGSSGGAGTGGIVQCSPTPLIAQPANNYTFASNITLTPATVKPKTELTFDWSGVTSDFLGRPTNPSTDVDAVLLVLFNLTLAGFEEHLNADDGSLQTFNVGALQLLTGKTTTSSSLFDFGVPGTPTNTYKTSVDVKTAVDDYLDPTVTDPATHIFAVMPTTGTALGSGTKMIQAFTLDAASTTTSLALGPSARVAANSAGHTGGTTGPTTSITFDADLQSLTPLGLPSGQANFMVDWSQMTTNGLGRPWLARSISRAMVGHYDKTLTELQDQFLDLQTIGTELYEADVPSDDPISLSDLKSAQGQAFTGIDNTGVWILALLCTQYCANPAPWYLTVLKTCN